MPSRQPISRCVISSPVKLFPVTPYRILIISRSLSSSCSSIRRDRHLNFSIISMSSTTSRCSCSHTSIRFISFPSLSVPIGSYKDTSRVTFFLARNIIKSSLSMHFAAYVASLLPFSALKVFTAFISPMVPMDIKSSISSPHPMYFLDTCATRRRFLSIRVCLAIWAASKSSPFIISRYSFSSLADKGCSKVFKKCPRDSFILLYEPDCF